MQQKGAFTVLALLVLGLVATLSVLLEMDHTAQAQTSDETPIVGKVLRGELFVRGEPSVAAPVIGPLIYDQRVTILSEQFGWLEIDFPPDSTGSGWISAHYVQIEGRPIPNLPDSAPTPSPALVTAPSVIMYRQPATFRWHWSDAVPNGIEWQFDVLIFRKNSAQQYKTITADLAMLEIDDDFYTLVADRFAVQCSSDRAVRVSQYENGRFRTYLSERSNRQDISADCPTPRPVQPRPRVSPFVPGQQGSEQSGGATRPASTELPSGITPDPTAIPASDDLIAPADIDRRPGSGPTPDAQPRAP